MTAFALPLEQSGCWEALRAVATAAIEIVDQTRRQLRTATGERAVTFALRNYVLLNPDGVRIGVIPVPERRPVFGRLEPTVYLRRG